MRIQIVHHLTLITSLSAGLVIAWCRKVTGPSMKIQSPNWRWIDEAHAFYEIRSCIGDIGNQMPANAVSDEMYFASSGCLVAPEIMVWQHHRFYKLNDLIHPHIGTVS